MAFSNYYNGYSQPNYINPYQSQNFGQPYGQNIGQIVQERLKFNNLQYATEDEIKTTILPVNSQLMAIDQDQTKNRMYVKSTNGVGQSKFEIYEYRKIDDNSEVLPKTQALTKDEVLSFGFADKKDLEPINSRLTKIEEFLSKISVKSDKQNG